MLFPRKVVYVSSEDLLEACDRLPKVRKRASIVHSLISAYGLNERMTCISPSPCTEKVLCSFHCKDYVEKLRQLEDAQQPSTVDGTEDEAPLSLYGLEYDCPVFPSISSTVKLIAGATMTACQAVMDKKCDVAINWNGGWHHCHRDSAAGFCYVNDAVLGILKLREKFNRILYVDLDIHHGDGVEEAFMYTDKVFTVSFHKHEDGYFPGTGDLQDVGKGNGLYHSLNIPLKDGTSDLQFVAIFKSVIQKVKQHFNPEVVVCQCGADTLSGDPMGGFSMTTLGVRSSVGKILGWNIPTILLGGGGYHIANTARCWTLLTADAVGAKLDDNIPEHKYFTLYGPGFDLKVSESTKRSSTTIGHLKHLNRTISANLQMISRKPLTEIQLIVNHDQAKKRKTKPGALGRVSTAKRQVKCNTANQDSDVFEFH